MGSIADMMLEGDLCEACGSALDGEGYGIPRYCDDECARDRGFDGIQSDGAGTYRDKKSKAGKYKQKPCLSIKITYNGQSVLDGQKTIKVLDVSKDKAEMIAQAVKGIVEEVRNA
jgi:hypothetical protein